jgi:hypothetical protein
MRERHGVMETPVDPSRLSARSMPSLRGCAEPPRRAAPEPSRRRWARRSSPSRDQPGRARSRLDPEGAPTRRASRVPRIDVTGGPVFEGQAQAEVTDYLDSSHVHELLHESDAREAARRAQALARPWHAPSWPRARRGAAVPTRRRALARAAAENPRSRCHQDRRRRPAP